MMAKSIRQTAALLKVLNSDEMVVADNQEAAPHFRFASGKGRTPTTFFLRAR
jgi:hypothetical protein